MPNRLELLENGQVVNSTSFDIINIKSSKWVDSLNNEIKQDGEENEKAFFGEELNFIVEIEGVDAGTELEIKVFAKNDTGPIICLLYTSPSPRD